MGWVAPTDTPSEDYSLIEKSQQWLVEIDDDGNLECEFQDTEGNIDGAITNNPVPVGSWSLIGCTFDSSSGSACAYIQNGSSGNENQAVQRPELGTLEGEAVHGVVLGARYLGGGNDGEYLNGSIDSVRIFNRVLSEHDVCVGGGRSGC